MKINIQFYYCLEVETEFVATYNESGDLTQEADTLMTEAVDDAYDKWMKAHNDFDPAARLRWCGTTISDEDGNEIQEES